MCFVNELWAEVLPGFDFYPLISEGVFFDGFESLANGFNSGIYHAQHYMDAGFYYGQDLRECGFPFQHYSPPKKSLSSCYHLDDRPPLQNGTGIGLVNGMNTTFEGAREHLIKLSDVAFGKNLDGVYNATHNFFFDGIECGINLYSKIATTPVRKLHQQWDEFFASSDKPYLQFCHSQGAIHVRNALRSYSHELRQKIIVVAIAPAAYISRDICKECYHYVSKRDFVPWFDVLGRIQCRKKDPSDIIFKSLTVHPPEQR